MNLSPEVKGLDRILRGKNLIEQSPLPTFVIDSEGNCVMLNDAFLKAYNIDRESIMGRSALTEAANIEHGVVHYMMEALSGKVVETPEVDFTTPHGERRVTRSRLFPVFDNDEVTHVVVMHEDITERRIEEEKRTRAEKESIAARERANIMDGIPDVVFVLDNDLNLLDLNETAIDRVGFSTQEVRGRSILESISVEDREKMSRGIKEIIEENRDSIEGKLITKNGKEIPHLWSISPFKNTDNGSRRIICVGRDITDLKRSREREEFLNSLLRHDVSNKSHIIQSFLELLKDTELSEEQNKLLEGALNCSKEEREIIKKVQTLREVTEEDVEEVNVDSVVKEVVEDYKYEASAKGIDIEIRSSENGVKVKGGQLLKEVFSNLVGNSIRHSDGSEIRINIIELDERTVCTVEDNGRGLTGEDKKKVFEKGYKKGEKAGSGLGMYLVNEIIESYKGYIEIKESELGGLRFDVHLNKVIPTKLSQL